MSTDTTREVAHISLLGSLAREWIKLPCECMRECGAAAQTLGGLLRLTEKETFASVKRIAQAARLPARTVKRHLEILAENDWVSNHGRQPTRAGRARRTATRRVTKKSLSAAETNYTFLPWWASCNIATVGRLKWCERAVLSVVMARMCSLRGAMLQEGSEGMAAIGAFEDKERFRFSLDAIERQTGLSRPAIVRGKRRLKKLGIVDWFQILPEHGGNTTHFLMPRGDFVVVETPTTPGFCRLSFSTR